MTPREVEFACPYCDRRTAMLASSLAAFVGYGGRPPSWICAPCWAARHCRSWGDAWVGSLDATGDLVWSHRDGSRAASATVWRLAIAREL